MKFSREEIREKLLVYAVTDRRWLKEGETLADAVREAILGGAGFVQLREKEADEETFLSLAREVGSVCREYGVPFVINDSIEIAKAAGADGVHLGQSDIEGRDVRALAGPDMILGITAHTAAEAKAAEAAGADYLGCGAVFATGTKKDAGDLSINEFKEICGAVSIPVVAIGGVSQDNIMMLSGTCAAGAAVVSAIFAAEDHRKAAEQLKALAEKVFISE